MKKKIAILGSTGSIGESILKIIQRDKKNFEINLLTTNKNINRVFKQAKEFKVKNIIISDLNSFKKAKIRFNKSKTNIEFICGKSLYKKIKKQKLPPFIKIIERLDLPNNYGELMEMSKWIKIRLKL